MKTHRVTVVSAGLVLVGCTTPAPMKLAGGPIIISNGPAATAPAAGSTVNTPIVVSNGPPATSAATAPAAPSPVANSFKLFGVYAPSLAGRPHYVPSGYMGDSDLTLSNANTDTPHGSGQCLRATYKASGAKGWAGLYWQNPVNNWGDKPGRAGYDLRGATRLTFWARGEKGGERIHEVRVGGIVGQYPDSDVANLMNIRLTKEWKEYTIDLAKKDLRHIIGGFGFFLNKAEDSGGAVFYLDDIVFEGSGAQTSPVVAAAPPLVGQSPAEQVTPPPVPPPLPPVVPATAKDLQVKEIETGLKVSFSSRLMFHSGQAVLVPTSGKVLDQLINLLSAYPTNRVLIEGHTDSTGDKHFNLRLSELRAKAVRDYLIKNGGYEESRFQIVGYGDTKPIADNGTAAGRAINRRVEVTILKSAKP